MILTERWRVMFGDEWYAKATDDETHRVHPSSIARVSGMLVPIYDVADKLAVTFQAYVYLSQQDKSAWTWELDCQ